MSKFPQSFGFDLADTLTGYGKHFPDLFKRLWFSVAEPESFFKDTAFAVR
jgi:hypothetical protein